MLQEFFAPAVADLVESVVAQYRQELDGIDSVCQFLHGDGMAALVPYFLRGNRPAHERYAPTVDVLFGREGAVAALNAHYWQRVMGMTDVLDWMPAKRREEWFAQIEGLTTPPFEDQTVRDTLRDLLAMRGTFLAEKVDGIFRALSRSHVTNQPEGFSKRMILTGVTNNWGSYSRAQTGHVNDLRAVIAKFMGRDEPDWSATNRVVEIARQYHRGEWLDLDGGALRMRCYLNGNAHLEVHPDIAWRLNKVLASLYPAAIPSRFRTAPPKASRAHTLMERPLPFAVLNELGQMARGADAIRAIGVRVDDKHVRAEVCGVLEAIGGVRAAGAPSIRYEFDYDAAPIIRSIVISGRIPDAKSHQYYPTPPDLAARVVELAEIGDGDQCLEPSAGAGALAELLPRDRTTCVEVSQIHAAVLRQKGFAVTGGDFLAWKPSDRFDRIVMNPPFSQGRWQAHLESAAALLAPGGRLVAVLPASAHGKAVPGLSVSYDGPHHNQFAGTSVSVTILIGVAH